MIERLMLSKAITRIRGTRLARLAGRTGLGRRVKRALEPDERVTRLLLLARMPRNSICAEVGVWKGDFSAQILKRVRPSKLHLIDPWEFEPMYPGSWTGGAIATGQDDMDAIFDAVRERFGSHIRAGQVEVHRASSTATADRFGPGYFDWIYIDANHVYEQVSADLEAYREKVKVTGFITGDDYGDVGWWEDGVRRAVDDFSERYGYAIDVIHGDQFILTRTETPNLGTHTATAEEAKA